MKNRMSLACITTLLTPLIACHVFAAEEVSVEVLLDNVKVGHSPLYVSVQDANQFRTNDAQAGTIVRSQEKASVSVQLSVEPGVYAVSIWHDLDEDGQFSRGKDYWPTDGWGSSGNPPQGKAPSFDDMKVEISSGGQVIPIVMQYVDK